MILTGDVHLAPDSEATVFSALTQMAVDAMADDKRVVIIGDFWKHRGYVVHTHLINRTLDLFDQFPEVAFWLVPGNHDQIDLSGTHALEAFRNAPNVRVYGRPETVLAAPGITVDLLPYRADPKAYVELLSKSTSRYAFLHHGIVGAWMNNGIVAGELDGLPPAWFTRYQWTFAAHWHRHHIVSGTTIVYCGSPWQVKADEAGQDKGWIVFSPKTGEWRFRLWNGGPRFVVAGLEQAKPGDTMIVQTGQIPDQVLTQFAAAGVKIKMSGPPIAAAALRLGVAKEAPLREHAFGYVKAHAKGLPENELMAVFDEMVQ
jgi:hypothetical protein